MEQFALIATHPPDQCPTANETIRKFFLNRSPEMTKIAEKLGVEYLAGPIITTEHKSYSIEGQECRGSSKLPHRERPHPVEQRGRRPWRPDGPSPRGDQQTQADLLAVGPLLAVGLPGFLRAHAVVESSSAPKESRSGRPEAIYANR